MEYFIVANSFAAPFVSDLSTHFIEAEDEEAALLKFAEEYKHPCVLYASCVYPDSNAYHKGKPPLARWLCNQAKFLEGKNGLTGCDTPGKIWIDGKLHNIESPKDGSLV